MDERQAHELKAAFLRRMAHEMRTPLGSILMLAELIAENASGRLGEREVGYAEKILRAGAEIRGLIEEVLELSRIETGAVAVEPAEVALAKLVEEIAEGFAELAGTKPLELATEVAAEVGATVRTDRRVLARLLRLLLTHVARVTPEGPVRLRVAARGDAAEIAVRDGAAAMTEDQLKTAFEPFQPGRQGLGPAIARALAELLGGRLAVRPAAGKGNVWTLRLPAA